MNSIKIFQFLLLILYCISMPLNWTVSNLDGLLLIVSNVVLLFKSKKHLPLFLMFLFIAYLNYSIVVGEYWFRESLSVPMTEVKTEDIYTLTLRVLLFFTGIIALFLTKVDFKSEIHKVNKGNKYLFTAIFLTLVYILIFSINRVRGASYAVAITPMYEYSKLLFVFGFYFARKNTLDTVFLSSLLVFFMLQDIYYGGRVTSIQLLFILGIFVFSEFLTIKKALLGGAIAVTISSFVGNYRSSYSLEGMSIFKVFNNMIESLFVFDTATYAYYASATHVAGSKIAMANEKIHSFLDFLGAVLLGVNTQYSEVTSLVNRFYYGNIGGGLIPTHFFFWFGWLGVAFISFFLVTLLNKLLNKKSDYSILLLISILVVSPRWYLYTPNALFRAALLFTTFLYLTLKVSEKITQKTI